MASGLLLQLLLTASDMRPEFAERTAEVMPWADPHGIGMRATRRSR